MRRLKQFVLLPLLLGMAGVTLTVSLGQWQTRRAQEKIVQQQHLERAMQAAPLLLNAHNGAAPGGLEWRRVAVQGEFLNGQTVYLDNRVREGVAGFYVLTPFKLIDGATIMVNRGWVARDVHHTAQAPQHRNIAGPVRIEGILRKEISQTLLLSSGAPAQSVIRQRFNLEEYQRESGLRLLPWIVFQQDSESATDGLIRDWKLPALGVEKNRGYAVQWYAMACAIALLSLWFQWKRIRKHEQHDK